MAEQMYKQAAPSEGADSSTPPSGASTQEQKDVIDAEFEEHQ